MMFTKEVILAHNAKNEEINERVSEVGKVFWEITNGRPMKNYTGARYWFRGYDLVGASIEATYEDSRDPGEFVSCKFPVEYLAYDDWQEPMRTKLEAERTEAEKRVVEKHRVDAESRAALALKRQLKQFERLKLKYLEKNNEHP